MMSPFEQPKGLPSRLALFFLTSSFLLSHIAFAASLKPSDCVGTVTSFPNCENLDAILTKCNKVKGKQASIDCFCPQEVLDAYVGCKGEARQCVLGNDFDSFFDKEIANWHDACDPYLKQPATTPTVAAPTATLEMAECRSYAESCAALSRATAACTSSFKRPADVTSCRCESSLISLASVCEIDGSSRCLMQTPVTSEVWEFKNCDAARTFSDDDPVFADIAAKYLDPNGNFR
ncbi:hypothetical protein CMUS01_16522 [Colletotrichum musicola]|uniref:Extracellular membrane protein CFEM domain-containing protein n=1 Tax=Colletotrichum musicola TaxID=2175873 RepID=A0A8H6IN06_9PEZI|nr:hypothetical protein CMUS01_16522 [Colletotrichum musicola]